MAITKIILAGVAIVAVMVVAQDQRWPEKVGMVGSCVPTAAPRSAPGGAWYSCRQGLINGFPELEADRCTSAGIVQHRQIWQCEVPLASLPGA